MPSLKQLTCTIEKGTENVPLTEYQTRFYDGVVETFIRVPSPPVPFSIHLVSRGWIAPGLAMFVFMDGVAQCNRNRRGLVIPDEETTRAQTEIDFRVRQKEDKFDDRRFIGREWSFAQLNTTASDVQEDDRNAKEGVGTIEVVVLRCHGEVKATANSKRRVGAADVDLRNNLDGTMEEAKSSKINRLFGFDGANDADGSVPTAPEASKSHLLGLDGANGNADSWPPSPSVPEQYRKYRDAGRRAAEREDAAGRPDPLANIAQAFQRHGLSSDGPPQVDGANSAAGKSRASHRAPALGPGQYPYPAPWPYPGYYMPQLPARPPSGQEWAPMWGSQSPARPASQAAASWKAASEGKAKSVASAAVDEVAWGTSGQENVQQTWENDWNEQKQDNKSEANNNWGEPSKQELPAWNQGVEQTDQQPNNNWGNNAWGNDDNTGNRSKSSHRSRKDAHEIPVDASRPYIKHYWSDWSRQTLKDQGIGGPYVVPEEPLRQVPERIAQENSISHQIRAGKGKIYYHTTGTPKYLDTMEKPYAVFVFKYRSKEALQRIFPGIKIKTDKIPLQDRWPNMNEDERLAALMKLQARVGSDTDDSEAETTASTARTKRSQKSKHPIQAWRDAQDNNDQRQGSWNANAAGAANTGAAENW